MEANDTKELIVNYLLNKFLNEPTRLDTVDEWARDLGMSKKTIYKYFTGKEQLLTELFTTLLERQRVVIDGIRHSPGSSLAKLHQFIGHFKLVVDYMPAGVIVQLERHYRLLFDQWGKYKVEFIDTAFQSFIEDGKKEGHILVWLNPVFLSAFWENSVRNLIIQKPYLTIMSTSSAFDEMGKLFLRGIATLEGLSELEKIGALK
jgi:AcrR family transcriptional regulator